jgi:flagellar motor switch protein FliN/FliY
MTQPADDTPQNTLMEEFASDLSMQAEDGSIAFGEPAPMMSPAFEAQPVVDDAQPRNLDLIMRIPVAVKVVLGSATMPVANLMKLGRGAVIPLDRKVGEPVDVMVSGRVVARGEVVVIDEAGTRFGVSVTEIIAPSSGGPSV